MQLKTTTFAPAVALGLAFTIALPGIAGIPAEPDATVEYVAKAVSENRLGVIWEALPPSYQSDITEMVHLFGENMDRDVWSGSMSIVGKLSQIVTEKGDFLKAHPMLGEAFAGEDSAKMGSAVDFLGQFSTDLADLDYLATMDPGAYLEKSGSELMKFAKENADPKDLEEMEKLGNTTADVLSSEGDRATLKIMTPGEEPEEVEMVRVEGRWVPAEMAEDWATEMADAKQQLRDLPAQIAGQKDQVMAMMTMFGGGLDQVLAASTQDEFNLAVNSMMGAVMGMAMSMQGAGAPAGQ